MSKICIELEDEHLKSVESLSKEIGMELEDVMKEIIKEGIIGLKHKVVKEKLESGEWTLRKAAKFLGVSFSDIIKFIEKEKIKLGRRPLL